MVADKKRKLEEKREALLLRGQEAMRAGHGEEAEKAFREAASLKPERAEALFFLGHFLQESGRPQAAIPFLRRAQKIAPQVPEITLQLGVAYQDAGNLEAAEGLFRQASEASQTAMDAHAMLGNLFALRGRHHEACECFRRALDIKPNEAWLRLNLGHSLQGLGLRDEAKKQYQAAAKAQPEFGAAHQSLARLAQDEGQFEDALELHRKALSLNENDPSAHHGVATALRDLGRVDEALHHFKRADEIHPNPVCRAAIASLLERAHRLEEAKAAAEAALELYPGSSEAHLVLAKILRRQGNEEGAIARYEALIQQIEQGRSDANNAVLARAKSDLAAAHEKAGRYDKALPLYRAANETNCAAFPDWQQESERFIERVQSLSGAVASLPSESGQHGDCNEVTPIFLVGFPRSGTTLLDQILNAHSQLTVMEEKTVLDRISHELGGVESERVSRSLSLNASEKKRLRERYFEESAQHLSKTEKGLTIVDKLPLNILNLWLVAALFPNARVILALRDPRDVCWSCYSNLFRLGPGLAGFADLKSTAELYRAVMTLWRESEEHLPLSCSKLRYEDLIADFESQARALIEALGLIWEEEVLSYRENVGERYIVTPSYHQVVQPLYSSARGRWRHYEEALRPILPVLAPFIEAFGYDS